MELDNGNLITASGSFIYLQKNKNWRKCAYFSDFSIEGLHKTKDGKYVAILVSAKLSRYDLYLSYSLDGEKWTSPVFTGIHNIEEGYQDKLIFPDSKRAFILISNEKGENLFKIVEFSVEKLNIDL